MKPNPLRVISLGIAGLVICAPSVLGQDSTGNAADTAAHGSLFMSAEDGWPDISGFLDTGFGFMPVLVPISEPAVGYGAAGGVAFIGKSPGASRPNVTFVGGFGTQNGSRGGFAADSRYWLDGRLQSLAGLLSVSVNLDYYGMGESTPAGYPLRYNLKPQGGIAQARYRIGESDFWFGLGYAFVSVEVSFDAPEGTPGLPEFSRKTNIGALAPSFSYDSRDNIFTPTGGTYAEAAAGIAGKALAGDEEFQRVQLLAIHYESLPEDIFLGLRGQAAAAFGEPPFYVNPFIIMRGVPAMRYQGKEIAQMEVELRWQCWKRFSLVAFGGGGGAWNDVGGLEKTQTTVAGGAGFRYELARKHGIHVGLDAAFGPLAGPSIYIIVGSAWMRP